MVQYNAALAITGAIKGTLRDHIYRELGLESVAERRQSRKIFFYHKLINGILPVYLQPYISYCGERVCRARSADQKNLDNALQEQKYLSYPFFLIVLKSVVILVRSFRKLNQQLIVKQKFSVRSDSKKPNFYMLHDTNGIKLMNHLRLHFSHLNEHKFR